MAFIFSKSIFLSEAPTLRYKTMRNNFWCTVFLLVSAQKLCLRLLKLYFKLDMLIFYPSWCHFCPTFSSSKKTRVRWNLGNIEKRYCYYWNITNRKSVTFSVSIKSALWGLRQFLAIESPLEMMKKKFYFILKPPVVLKIFKFLSLLFVHVAKRLA